MSDVNVDAIMEASKTASSYHTYHVEVRMQPYSTMETSKVQLWWEDLFRQMPAGSILDGLSPGEELPQRQQVLQQYSSFMQQHQPTPETFLNQMVTEMQAITLSEKVPLHGLHGNAPQTTTKNQYCVYVYRLQDEEPFMEEMETGDAGSSNRDDGEYVPVCENWTLPHQRLEGLWESLIMDTIIKSSLMHYAYSTLHFSKAHVSPHLVSWNRLILLHGPPGTGKTSLCRALAQKLAIRLSSSFPNGTQLLDLQSHSLFSKWFSTSGKLIQRLFDLIRDMVQNDPETLVCVLMDEIESLAASRSHMMSGGTDPTDAMRAVNALLTSLDSLKSYPNLLVLATTNLTNQIDVALLDRTDLKLYIGPPNDAARRQIIASCLEELVRAQVLWVSSEQSNHGLGDSASRSNTPVPIGSKNSNLPPFESNHEQKLLLVVQGTKGWSGRALRKLPLQTHANAIGKAPSLMVGCDPRMPIEFFLSCMLDTIQYVNKSKEDMTLMV